jgi:hypothetical protein
VANTRANPDAVLGAVKAASASNLWVQSSLAQKQRLQQVFFADGIRLNGKGLVGTGATLPVFNYLSPDSDVEMSFLRDR